MLNHVSVESQLLTWDISQLSVQLRARLSYAAAKVEKDWQQRPGEEKGRVIPRPRSSTSSHIAEFGSKLTPRPPRSERTNLHQQNCTGTTDSTIIPTQHGFPGHRESK